MPPKTEHVTEESCKKCRDGSRWLMRTVMTMIGLILVLVGWSLWCSYEVSASAAVIRSEQAVQSKDSEWIKDTLTRIEKRMDALHLAGGE